MNEKGHILENLGQFKDETPLNSMQILSFWSVKMAVKIKKRALCVGTARQKYLK